MVYVKIKDIPDGTFFGYDVEKAKIKYGDVCSSRDIWFKIGEYNNKNDRIIHFTMRYGATETTMGKQTKVYESQRDDLPYTVIEKIFTDRYNMNRGF